MKKMKNTHLPAMSASVQNQKQTITLFFSALSAMNQLSCQSDDNQKEPKWPPKGQQFPEAWEEEALVQLIIQ